MKKINPKLLKRIIALVVCIAVIVVSIYSCNRYQDKQKQEEQNSSPTVSVSVIDKPGDKDQINQEIDEVDDIYSLVCSTVSFRLTEAGFISDVGVAQTVDNQNYSVLGLYYYNDEINFFNDPSMKSVGFVEVVSSDEKFKDPSEETSVIMVNSVGEEEDETQLICTYNYEDIGSSHFVYKDKYVKYYQQSAMRVVYDVYDNVESNYDLSLGSLYDYDNKVFIYDESIFGEYTTHSAEDLFNDEDYEELEKYLKELSDSQLKAGYIVEEYTLVYISPESLQAYIESEEEDTFFGYSVSELTEAFGPGTALQYTEDGFVESNVIDVTTDEYNWKSFLAKSAIGSGIILVGAVLTPVTGGASFGCALITITKVSVTFALSSGLGSLAVETVKGMIQGKSIEDALRSASHKGLDSFANGFMIGAAVGSVGVVSGVIKPVACFVEGTPVIVEATAGVFTYKCIEDLAVGDKVLAYDMETGIVSKQMVTETYRHAVNELTYLYVENDCIKTTPNHPFYSPEYDEWIQAGYLSAGSMVLDANGNTVVIKSVENVSEPEGINVYNMTVDSAHTYFVGGAGILVHNNCTNIANMRSKAIKDAWKNEVEAVKNGTSKYNWTPAEKLQMLKFGKVKGYEGHHIITVKELQGKMGEELIASADDIVFLTKSAHMKVHNGGDTFAETKDILIKLVPWVTDRIEYLLPLIG